MRSAKSMYDQAVNDYHYIVNTYGKLDDLAEAYEESFWLVFGLSNGYRFSYSEATNVIVSFIGQTYRTGYRPNGDEHIDARSNYEAAHVRLLVDVDKRLQTIRDRWSLTMSV